MWPCPYLKIRGSLPSNFLGKVFVVSTRQVVHFEVQTHVWKNYPSGNDHISHLWKKENHLQQCLGRRICEFPGGYTVDVLSFLISSLQRQGTYLNYLKNPKKMSPKNPRECHPKCHFIPQKTSQNLNPISWWRNRHPRLEGCQSLHSSCVVHPSKWLVTPIISQAMKFGHLEGVPQPDPDRGLHNHGRFSPLTSRDDPLRIPRLWFNKRNNLETDRGHGKMGLNS